MGQSTNGILFYGLCWDEEGDPLPTALLRRTPADISQWFCFVSDLTPTLYPYHLLTRQTDLLLEGACGYQADVMRVDLRARTPRSENTYLCAMCVAAMLKPLLAPESP